MKIEKPRTTVPLAVAALCALLAAEGRAAEHPDPLEPRELLGPELMLLSSAEVQTDLGLDAKQVKKIEALSAGFHADANREMAEGKAASPEEAIANLDDEVAAYNRELAALLTPAQRQRVRQIQIQMVGNVALLEPPIQRRLELDPKEVEKVDLVARENVAKVKELRRKLALGEVSPEEFRTKVAALGRELDRSLGEAVSPETRTKLDELGGKPFAGIGR